MTQNRNMQGQMLLVVVLTMIVALTVGLSVVSRTIIDLRISRQAEESQRAFQAAEAGIEHALQSAQDASSPNFTDFSSYTTTVSNPEGTNFLLNAGELVDQSSGIDLWLSDFPDYSNPRSGTLTIYWSPTATQQSCDDTGGAAINSALEVVILSGSVLNPTLSKYVYDGCGRIPGAISGAGGTMPTTGVAFNYAATISGITDGLVARIIPIYNSSVVGVVYTPSIPEGPGLPNQGTIIESVGESGDSVRKVQYFSSHPQIPLEIFPYSIISQ